MLSGIHFLKRLQSRKASAPVLKLSSNKIISGHSDMIVSGDLASKVCAAIYFALTGTILIPLNGITGFKRSNLPVTLKVLNDSVSQSDI